MCENEKLDSLATETSVISDIMSMLNERTWSKTQNKEGDSDTE